MTGRIKITMGLGCTVLLITLCGKAFALIGDEIVYPAPPDCSFTEVKANLEVDGRVRYHVVGTCLNAPMTGEMTYGADHEMKETFFYQGATLSTVASCPADPWVSGAPCSDPQIMASKPIQGPLLTYPVPLSLRVIGAPQTFQIAIANATHPREPGPPINPMAREDVKNSAVVYWLAPGENPPFGPFLSFVVQGEPRGALGRGWTDLGSIGRHQAFDYRLSVKLPTITSPGSVVGWELRVCSSTVFSPRICTQPVIPAPLAVKQGTTMNETRTATPPRTSNTLNSPGSSTTQKAAANPQPFPPKALPAPSSSLNRPLLRRGVPQEGSTAAGKTPVEPKPAP